MKKNSQQHFDDWTAEALYGAWCEGHLAAAKVLLENWQPQLLMIAFQYTNHPELAKDLAQNVWVEICKKAKANYEIQSFKSFLFIVCRNKYFDQYRKTKNSKAFNAAPDQLPDTRFFDLEKQLRQREEVRLSKQFILSLPPLQKQCYTLYVLEEMSMEEIAQHLDITINQVRGRIDRAKTRMKNLKKKIL
ncbi:MAG: sigma-70 family RNA polymerase sigma factor [Bacteroidota bacterium]